MIIACVSYLYLIVSRSSLLSYTKKLKNTYRSLDAYHLHSINIGTCQDVTKTILHLPLCEKLLGAYSVHYISPWSTYILPVKESRLGAPRMLRDLSISNMGTHTYIDMYVRTNYNQTTFYIMDFTFQVNLKDLLHLNNLRP